MKKEPLTVYISKLILIVSAIVSFGALIGAVGYLASHPEWKEVPIINPPVQDFYSCAEDSDCISVKNDCCGCTAGGTATAINKNLKDQWKNNCGRTGVFCPAVMSDDPSCFSEPRCVNNKCILKSSNEIETEIKSAVIGEDFLITLDANPSTGYLWTADFDKNYLMLRSEDFIPAKVSPETVGAGGKEVFAFTPLKAGETTIKVGYSRPWESRAVEIKVFKYNIQEKPGTVSGNELVFETIMKNGITSVTEKGNYVIKNNKDWLDLLYKIRGGTDLDSNPPKVNFDKDMIVAVFQGEKNTGGYDIEINRITEKENAIEILVTETSPGPRCMVTQAFTSPYHIVKVQKTDKKVMFNIITMTTNCLPSVNY